MQICKTMWTSKMSQGVPCTSVAASVGGAPLRAKGPAEQNSKWKRQAPDSALPRICTNPWRRGHLAALFHNLQLHCPFPKELWILQAAAHGWDFFAIYCLGADPPCRLLRGHRDAIATIYFSRLLSIIFLFDFASSCLLGRGGGKKKPLQFGR